MHQGRPLNVNHEAACFIGKTGGGGVEKGALRGSAWKWGEEYAFFNGRSKVGGNWRGFASLLQGGMNAPGPTFVQLYMNNVDYT